MDANLGWYIGSGGTSEEIAQWMRSRSKRAELQTRISDSKFVQANLLIDLIFDALQTSLRYYIGDQWREQIRSFHFVLDGKLPNKLGAGERYLSDALVPVLGSNRRFAITLADAWRNADPPHPFIELYERDGGWSGVERLHVQQKVIGLSGIFVRGLRFEPSHAHAGLQLADTVAYVVRRAVLDPDDWHAQTAYDLIRPNLRDINGHALSVVRFNTDADPLKATRYRHLVNA